MAARKRFHDDVVGKMRHAFVFNGVQQRVEVVQFAELSCAGHFMLPETSITNSIFVRTRSLVG